MKKAIFLLLTGVILTTTALNASGKTFSISPEAMELSNDAQFSKVVNLIIDFSANVALHENLDVLNRYVENKASENDVKIIMVEAGVSNTTDLKAFFSKIVFLRESVNHRFSFMANNERGREIVKDALLELAKRGSINKLKNLDVDCLAAYMANVAICWWAYDQCMMFGNDDCIGQQIACYAMVVVTAQQCFAIVD